MDEDVLASAIAVSTAVMTFWEKVMVVGGELLDLDHSFGGETEEEEHQAKSPRYVHPRQLCEDSLFGQMLKAPEALLAPQTAEARFFRKRVRFRYRVFLELVKYARNEEWFVEAEADVAGRKTIPDEYKVSSKSESY